MSTVRFASVCDVCGARSEEYTVWPSCRDCLKDVCPACAAEASRQEHERDVSEDGMGLRAIRWLTVLCRPCAAESEAA